MHLYCLSVLSSARLRDHAVIRQTRLASADDSVYSDVYSTINEELAELSDPFDGDNEDDDHGNEGKKSAKRSSMRRGRSTTSLLRAQPRPEVRHAKTKSMTSLMSAQEIAGGRRLDDNGPSSNAGSTQTMLAAATATHAKSNSTLTVTPEMLMPPDMAPPLPMRSSKCRPPARPPYPSSLVRAVQEITQPLHM